MDAITPTPTDDHSVARRIAVPVVLAAVAAVIGWLLLLVIKGIVVLATYALGGALVVVPLLMSRKLVAQRHGMERWRRILGVAGAVLVGVALIAIAGLLHRHGWLLIAIPAALVLIVRVVDAFLEWRDRRRAASTT